MCALDGLQTRPTSSRPVLFGLLAYWTGMLVAARNYPGGYDWPYTTISSLVYAERNPTGFLWARIGMVLCGMLGLYWTARLGRSSKHSPAPPTIGKSAMRWRKSVHASRRSLHGNSKFSGW